MDSKSFGLNQSQTQSTKQLQRLMMSPKMQQGLHLMQVPIMELSALLEAEIEQNPILEYDTHEPIESEEIPQDTEEKELKFDDRDLAILRALDEDFREHFSQSDNYYTKRSEEEEKKKAYQEQSIRSQESLHEHLMAQVAQIFDEEEERQIAEALIGNLNAAGFLQVSLSEIALLNHFSEEQIKEVLHKIQTFDPPGIAAYDLRECLLIQLRYRGEKRSLAYQIIDRCFDDLIHNRIPAIRRKLKCNIEAIMEEIHHKIALLDLHPGTAFSKEWVQLIVPDALVIAEDGGCKVEVNEKPLPIVRLNMKYLKLLDDPNVPPESKEFIRDKLSSAKWLLRNIDQRNATLYRILEALTRLQKAFFMEPNGSLLPLTMRAVAEELGVHESTIARAVAHKYVDTPRGVVSIKSFFVNAYVTAQGEDVSSKTVRDLLKKMIGEENKKAPLSDETLSQLLEKKGIPCARRTVAKYRSEMQIGNTKQRREYD